VTAPVVFVGVGEQVSSDGY
jgi:hypothetical protein